MDSRKRGRLRRALRLSMAACGPTSRRIRTALPRLHVVTDDDILARPDFSIQAERMLRLPIALHVRGPRTNGRTVFELAEALSAEPRPGHPTRKGRLIVNDRLDIALSLPVDGVHLGARSFTAVAARELIAGVGPTRAVPRSSQAVRGSAPNGLAVGVSIRLATTESIATPDPGGRKDRDPDPPAAVDYVFAGNLFETRSHPGRPGAGLAAISRTAEAAKSVPVIAIGGITPKTAADAFRAGAYGIAVVSGVWGRTDLVHAAEDYLRALP